MSSNSRDPDRAALKAVEDAIAQCSTPHLLLQKAALEAKLGIVGFERKDLEPLTEMAVPRRPGRPRKPRDDSAVTD